MLNVNGTPCPFKWRFPSQKMSMRHSRPLVSGNTQNSGSWRYCSWWKKIGCTRPCICDICDATSVTYDVPPRRCIVLECWSVKTVGHKLLEAEEHVIAWKKIFKNICWNWLNERMHILRVYQGICFFACSPTNVLQTLHAKHVGLETKPLLNAAGSIARQKWRLCGIRCRISCKIKRTT